MRKNKLSILLPIILLLAGYLLGYQSASSKFEKRASVLLEAPAEITESRDDLNFPLFWEVWEAVQEKYVDVEELDPDQMLYGAMKGIVRSLGDPHSEFLDPIESEEFMNSLEGSLTGVGAEIGMRDDFLVVISPLRGSPAETAGLLPGDHIFKINEEFASDFTVYEAVKRIRGEPGTDVTLTVFRDGELDPLEITITRDYIDIESVLTELREDGIAVVTVTTFAEDTSEEFTTALADLALQDPEGLIVDLRFNGGGFLDAAIEMVSKLLASGDVVKIYERGQSDKIISVSGAPLLPETPLVVLINEGSASASEIMAGALQDAERATVIGQQSFGKGTVQELVNGFSDHSTLRITVAKWFTPSGRDVTEEGITPDIEIEMSIADWLDDNDPQLEAAVEFLLSGQVPVSSDQ